MPDEQEESDRPPTERPSQHRNVFGFLFDTDVKPRPEQPDTAHEDDERSLPWHIDLLGQSGVYMGVTAVGLAVGGLTLGWFNIQPYTNIAITFSLVIALASLLVAVVVQIYQSDFSLSVTS